MVSVLTIAGSDPSGGAGIEADLSVFAALGIHGRTAITALTVQGYNGYPEQSDGSRRLDDTLSVHPTSSLALAAILNTHERDILPDAIKIGMIGTLANLQVICGFLGRHPQIPVVLDPVLRATSGLALLEGAALPMLKGKLWPRADVMTPNLDEVGVLLGQRPTTVAEMETAARELQHGNQVVVVKGGHLPGDPVDVVWNGSEVQYLGSPRVAGPNVRGTGCRLASAIASYLALGKDPRVAIQCAREWLVTRFL